MVLPVSAIVTIGAVGIGVMAFLFMTLIQREPQLRIPVRAIEEPRGNRAHPSSENLRQRPINCETCSICQEDIGGEHAVSRMRCEHRFHTFCLDQWLKFSKTCPTCRSPL